MNRESDTCLVMTKNLHLFNWSCPSINGQNWYREIENKFRYLLTYSFMRYLSIMKNTGIIHHFLYLLIVKPSESFLILVCTRSDPYPII